MNIEEEIKQIELKLKQKELNKKWFENPVYGTVILGFVTILFNIIINSCNNKQQSDLEKDKFEYSVYLKAFESGSQKEAINLIEFYEGLGIIKPNKFTTKKIEEKSLPVYHQNSRHFNEIYTDVFVINDINGDYKKDTVYFNKPKIIDEDGSCLGQCNIIFEFSNEKIPSLKIQSSGSAIIESCADINNDNIDEILIIKKGLNGTWYGANIYSLKENKWVLLFDKGAIHYDGKQEIYSNRILKNNNEFYFLNNEYSDKGDDIKKKIKIL
ncbi:hypothetical protein [Flavobacterium columnare]|uniref:hypothetical protein n=1 Tax=Flavobacterium columnare TaxID=996 RepID=UPI0040333289